MNDSQFSNRIRYKDDLDLVLEKKINRLIQDHRIKVESLTEDQLAEAVKQAIKSGDFVRFIHRYNGGQSVVYEPFYEKGQLERENKILRAFIDESEKYIATGFMEEYKQFKASKLGLYLKEELTEPTIS